MSLGATVSLPRRILGASWRLLVVLWLAGLIALPVSVVAPLMARRLINLFAAQPRPPMAEVNLAVGLAAAALVASAILAAVSTYVSVRGNEMGTRALTLEVYRRMLRLAPAFFQDQEVQRINNRALDDTAQVADFWLNAAAGAPLALAAVACYGWLMLRANPALGACAMLLSLLSGYFLLLDRRIQDVNRRGLEARDRIRVSTAEVIGGVAEIRQGATFEHALRGLERRFEENRAVVAEIAFLRGLFAGAGPLAAAIQNGTVQWLGAAAAAGVLLTRSGAMTWGDVVAFMGILALFQTPVRTLAAFVLDWRMTRESNRRLREYLDQPEAFRSGPDAPALCPDAPIRFEQVDVVAAGGARILSEVSLDLAPGRHLAMAGPAGSGKSTALQLLARNQEASRGRITVGGIPLESCDLDSVARSVGFVPQQALLFNTSLRNNLLLGLRRPSGRGFEDAEGWIDTRGLPEVAGPEDLDRRLVETLGLVGLEEDVLRKALDGPLAGARGAFLAGRITGLRQAAAARLREAGLILAPFGAAAWFPGSIGENLFGPGFGRADLAPAVAALMERPGPAGEALLRLGWHRYATENYLARRIGPLAPGLLQYLPTRQPGAPRPVLAASPEDPAGLPRPVRAMLLEFALEASLDGASGPWDGAGLRRQLLEDRRRSGPWPDRWARVESGKSLDHLALRDNLLGGRVEPDLRGAPEQVDRLLRRVLEDQGLYQQVLVAGLDTGVGEWGRQLSGGQRQKVAIGRVLMKDPGILLLDEATASLDELSQARIVDLVRERFKGRTVVSVSHRLSALRDSHRIVVLDRGRVVQEGGYEELASAPGVFRELASQQGAAPADLPAQAPVEEDRVRQLAMVPLFASLDAARLAFVARAARTVRAPAGTVLYQRGEPGRELFVILQGEVEFFAGDTVVTGYAQGRAFGEVALFTGGLRTLGARARTDTVLCVLDQEDLHRLLEADPGIARSLLQGLALRLAELTDRHLPGSPGLLP